MNADSPSVYYREGFKYVTARDFRATISIHPSHDIITEFISLTTKGLLIVLRNFPWDGPSGPTRDSKSSMRGSLIHDALYKLFRWGYLDPKVWRKEADRIFKKYCREDGMNRFRAWFWMRMVRRFAAFAASPEAVKKVIKAP